MNEIAWVAIGVAAISAALGLYAAAGVKVRDISMPSSAIFKNSRVAPAASLSRCGDGAAHRVNSGAQWFSRVDEAQRIDNLPF